ncbi:acyltransferase [Desulfobulbus sp. TB]|nr:acyltransferase [Desulfobulbus sp. TB]
MQNIQTTKYEYIDALRGIAILGVVLVHSSQWVAPTASFLTKVAAEGARGVQLFYIASALTLFLSMAARNNKEERPILSFYIRRFFRIAPLFYCAIIIYTAYYGMSARYWAPNGLELRYIPLTALFMHGWHPETITSVVPGGWSIAVEMTFYLFVPYLFLKLNSIKSTLIALLLSLILSRITSVVIVYLMSPYYPEDQQYLVESFSFLWFFSQLPVFIAGILLYYAIKKYPYADKQVALLLLAVSLFLFLAFLSVSTFGNLLPKHFLYGVAFIIFALSLNYYPNRFFVNGLIVWAGKLSFSIYLVHFGVLIIMRLIFSEGFWFSGNMGFILAFILVLTSSAAISYVSYRIVELPGINLGKRLIKKL